MGWCFTSYGKVGVPTSQGQTATGPADAEFTWRLGRVGIRVRCGVARGQCVTCLERCVKGDVDKWSPVGWYFVSYDKAGVLTNQGVGSRRGPLPRRRLGARTKGAEKGGGGRGEQE